MEVWGCEPGRVPPEDPEKLWDSKWPGEGALGEKVGGEHWGLGPGTCQRRGNLGTGEARGLGAGEVRLKTCRAAQARSWEEGQAAQRREADGPAGLGGPQRGLRGPLGPPAEALNIPSRTGPGSSGRSREEPAHRRRSRTVEGAPGAGRRGRRGRGGAGSGRRGSTCGAGRRSHRGLGSGHPIRGLDGHLGGGLRDQGGRGLPHALGFTWEERVAASPAPS